MVKWMITNGDGAKPRRRTIISADTENAAMQIARQAFGADATWKQMTDAEAEGMEKFIENVDEASSLMGHLGRQIEASIEGISAHYDRKDVPKDVFGVLFGMAFRLGGGIEPTDHPFQAILDMAMAEAGRGRAYWAASAARMQQFLWEGDDRYGAEQVGFDELLDVSKRKPPVQEILAVLEHFYRVPPASRDAVASCVGLLTEIRMPELGVTWAEDYASVLRTIFAACDFTFDID